MADLLDGLLKMALSIVMRGELVTIVSFDPATASYDVSYRGLTIGPVWSVNSVKHDVGKKVLALVKENVIVGLLP